MKTDLLRILVGFAVVLVATAAYMLTSRILERLKDDPTEKAWIKERINTLIFLIGLILLSILCFYGIGKIIIH